MATEIVLKGIIAGKDDYKVVQRGDMIESINRLNQVFHYLDLSYIKQNIFFHGWIGFRTNEQFKAVQDDHVLKLFQQFNCRNALVECTKMSGSFDEANDWLAGYYMPKLISAGLRNVAIVLPQNIFAQMAVEEWDKKVGGFTSRNFGTLNNAINWLKTA
jgi:hypothetical protein